MIISNDFVFLHPPKTGGSFVTEAIIDVYSRQCGHSISQFRKHGGVEHIPPGHSGKPLVTTVRNRFDYFVSNYQFGYWINREVEPWLNLWDDSEMKSRFSSYPYLRFREFIQGALDYGLKYLPRDKQALANALRIGPLTVRILQFSVPNYLGLLEDLLKTGDTAPLRNRIAKTRFLHTESLNRETAQWLIDLGVSRELSRQVVMKSKVQPLNTPDGVQLDRGHGQPRHLPWSAFFDQPTWRAVVEREWLFFKLFPEYQPLLEAGIGEAGQREAFRITEAGNAGF